jgi:hypothetical protein
MRDARTQMLRRGREWLPDTGQVLKCPYTGAEIKFIEVPGGVRPTGMLDPDVVSADSDKMYYRLGMRDGVPAPGTVPEEVPCKLEVRHEDSEEPFEIRQMDQKKFRAKNDTLAALKEAAGPEVAKVLARRNK